MSIRVKVPGFLFAAVDGKSEIVCDGSTVEEALYNFVSNYPKSKPYFFNENNQFNQSVLSRIYLNNTNIGELQGEKTKLEPGDEIFIIPVYGGG